MEEEQIIIAEFDNEIDAELARGHLEASGIPASIMKDDGGGMLPSLQNTEGVQLLVSKHLEENARIILSQHA
jgi:hypothetical protein